MGPCLFHAVLMNVEHEDLQKNKKKGKGHVFCATIRRFDASPYIPNCRASAGGCADQIDAAG
jgi:hypothetical protein